MGVFGNMDKIYYTKYDIMGDTTLYQLLQDANYRVHYNSAFIYIRATGTVAPQTGSYTMNNYVFFFSEGNLVAGGHFYKSGRGSPNSIPIGLSQEADNTVSIQNGILRSNNSTSTSCLGTTGDNVVIMEMPFDYDKFTGAE